MKAGSDDVARARASAHAGCEGTRARTAAVMYELNGFNVWECLGNIWSAKAKG